MIDNNIPFDPEMPDDLKLNYVGTKVAARYFRRDISNVRIWCRRGWIDCAVLNTGKYAIRRVSVAGRPPGMDKFEPRKHGRQPYQPLSVEQVVPLLHVLDGHTERPVIEMRLGLGEYAKMSQREVSRVLGVSRQRVGQIERKAWGKLEALNEQVI